MTEITLRRYFRRDARQQSGILSQWVGVKNT
jgi:hypothetical protein